MLIVAGCRPAGSGYDIVVDTLSNGAIRVTAGETGRWEPEAAWRLRESLRLGNLDANDAQTFGQVWDVERDRLGRTYVLDRLAKVIQVFEADGRYLRTLGRQGGGPGEFEEPFGLTWDPDGNLWVLDVRLSRYSVFDTTGAHLGEFRRQVGGYGWPWPARFTPDGHLVEPDLRAEEDDHLVAFRLRSDETPGDAAGPATLPPGGSGARPTVAGPVVLVASDTFPDPAAAMSPGDFWILERGAGRSFVGIPFGRRGYRILTPDGTVWTGYNATYQLVRQTLRGDTLTIIERSVDATPVSSDERAAAIEALGEAADHPQTDLSRIPSTKPFFRNLATDDSGRLWVLREGGGDAWFFDVYDVDGTLLGAVTLPVVPELLPPPRIHDDAILLVTRDSLDVQYVVTLTVQRP